MIGPHRHSIRNISKTSEEKRLIVLFPMTRGMGLNLDRWKSLISMVNNSEVSTLVLIDKTPNYQATEFFVENEDAITPKILVFQRPRDEPTHDSQAFIRLEKGLWILQMHDDDDWRGVINLPKNLHGMTVVRTQFTIINGQRVEEIESLDKPDCRSIFSILPSSVWNHFASMINEQGGHVAGSIDSSLNLVVSGLEPHILIKDFTYIYDNRHWGKRRNANKQLRKITKEDGWGRFATIEVSLVARAIDGVSSLRYFSNFLDKEQLDMQLDKWMRSTKPRRMRITLKFVHLKLLWLCNQFCKTKMFPNNLTSILEDHYRYHNILLKSWNTKKVDDYLQVVDLFLQEGSLQSLFPRFLFWRKQLEQKSGALT